MTKNKLQASKNYPMQKLGSMYIMASLWFGTKT